ncbi:MAG: BrnT family toxin [Synergistaceae bacterium]|nr:BrnT family toxin [Synergistaceae bacterium]
MKKIENAEIKLELGGMLFTWDDEKEKINIRKHGIDFTTAASVFNDFDAVFEDNSVDDYTGEERFDVIGLFAGYLMYVVYVERLTIDNNDIIRIISARDANKEERKRYVNGHK